MKKFFLQIVILFFFLTKIGAQTITNSELDKFVGTWRWVSNVDTVEIILEKQAVYSKATSKYYEDIVGWHRYVKNGVLIESSIQFTGGNYNSEANANSLKSTIYGFTQKPTNLYITFWDITLNKGEELWFTLLPGSTTQSTWKLRDSRGLYMGPAGTAGKITLPKDLILTKL